MEDERWKLKMQRIEDGEKEVGLWDEVVEMMWFGCWVVDCGGCVWPRNKKDLVLVVGTVA